MKVVILAGGYGTRISEETAIVPKPLVEIGGEPILWHIMKIYSAHGLNDFVVCCGYKGHLIKRYFIDLFIAEPTSRSISRPTDRGASDGRRAVARDAGRHRRDTMTGGPRQPGPALYRRRNLLPDLRRRRQRHRHHGTDRVPPRAGQAGHRHRRAAARALRRARPSPTDDRRRPASRKNRAATAPGSMAASSCWSRRCSTTSTATTTIWEQEPMNALAEDGQLTAFRHDGLLAGHGYVAGQARASADVGLRRSALEGLEPRPGRGAGPCKPPGRGEGLATDGSRRRPERPRRSPKRS